VSKVVRVSDDGLVEWLEGYAKQRKVPVSKVVTAALAGFRDDCERGVPDLPRAEAEHRVQAVRSQVPGVKTAAEVRADPVRAAAVARMAKIYGRDARQS
jgi:hypothetical protein